jgi:hypothetical protein
VNLPAVATTTGYAVADPDTGEMINLADASDRALASAAAQVARLDQELLTAKRALAAELRERHGIGRVHAGGYGFRVAESTSWPLGPTQDALARLVHEGWITAGEALRCLPERPKPDARQLNALAVRLARSNPDAARVLSEACTVSPPSVRDLEPVVEVDGHVVVDGLRHMADEHTS